MIEPLLDLFWFHLCFSNFLITYHFSIFERERESRDFPKKNQSISITHIASYTLTFIGFSFEGREKEKIRKKNRIAKKRKKNEKRKKVNDVVFERNLAVACRIPSHGVP